MRGRGGLAGTRLGLRGIIPERGGEQRVHVWYDGFREG